MSSRMSVGNLTARLTAKFLRGPGPFEPIVWPGTGPQPDLDRNWPELAAIALAVLLFWRSGPATGAGITVEAAQQAALNPILGLPAVLLGATAGVRFALFVGLLAAAAGMWWLGLVLGLERFGRMWASLAYTFAGGLAAGLATGRFGLDLAMAWIPWAVACAVLAVRLRRRLYAAGAAAALALALLGADFGLAIAAVVVLALFLLVAGVSSRRDRPYLALRRNEAAIAGLIVLVGLGLAAIRLLPQLALGTQGSQGLPAATVSGAGHLLAALLVRPEPPVHGAPFTYLGVVPILFLAGLPAAVRRENRRALLGLGLLAALAVLCAAGGWFSRIGAAAAMLAWGAAAVLTLGGLGLEALWRWAAANLRLRRMNVPAAVRWAAARLALGVLALCAAFSIIDLYRAGQSALLSGAVPAPWKLNVGDVLRFNLTQHPVLFWVGAAMSTLSFLGLLALIIDDVRSRRARLEVEAVYADGVLRPAAPLGIPDGTPVHVTVEAEGVEQPVPPPVAPAAAAETAVETAAAPGAAAPARATSQADTAAPAAIPAAVPAVRWAVLGWSLFILGLLVYAFTRLWHIDKFPIYFFTDEAANPLFAQDLIDRGFRSGQGTRFPLYFELAANRWGPLLSVYVHAVSLSLFGKSVIVTRATQAIVSILAPISVALSLKLVFKARFWWMGALLMALAPAWFLHSRTGFETIIAASFYACFILSYLLYRMRSPRYLYAAILFGVATFYTYSNGQLIMVVAGALLALTDIRYHLKNWRITLPGVLLIALAALPALNFQDTHPGLLQTHLRVLDSYWFYDKPLSAKLAQLVKTYAYGLNPAYWFIPNQADLARHQMPGYGNMSFWLLPFFLVGVAVSLWRAVKGSVPHRILLIAILATPAGAALAQIALTRVMAFVVPATVLIALGIEALLGLVKRRGAEAVLAPVLFVALAAPSLWMLRDALVNGPLWFRDYQLYGMQYGATQLFGEAIPRYLDEHPDSQIIVSPTWANGTDNFLRFFLSGEQQSRVQMSNVDYYMLARRPLTSNMVLVMTPEEYERAKASDKFKSVEVDLTLPYPDGRTGFYFARVAYADNLEEILAQEREARSRPVQDQVTVDGQTVELLHSQLDIGAPVNLFDGDTFTLVRGLEANPLVFEFTFPEPRPVTGLSADFASMDFALTVKLYADENAEPKVYAQEFRGLPPDPHADMAFAGAPPTVKKLRLEVLQLNAPQEVHIHVRELKFLE